MSWTRGVPRRHVQSWSKCRRLRIRHLLGGWSTGLGLGAPRALSGLVSWSRALVTPPPPGGPARGQRGVDHSVAGFNPAMGPGGREPCWAGGATVGVVSGTTGNGNHDQPHAGRPPWAHARAGVLRNKRAGSNLAGPPGALGRAPAEPPLAPPGIVLRSDELHLARWPARCSPTRDRAAQNPGGP